jgi:dephospho-CoA kinase
MPDDQKIKFADYVLNNSEGLDGLEMKVDKIYRELRRPAGHSLLRNVQESSR